MNSSVKQSSFVLWPETAADLMTPNPVSIRASLTVKEAATVLTDREIGALPVIDEAGRPIGVLSSSDIVRHERHKAMYVPKPVKAFRETEMTLASGEHLTQGFEVEVTDPTRVQEIMTPTILTVSEDDPTERVLADFLAFKVHHLFVVDAAGAMVGVIGMSDILRHLKPLKL